MKEIQLIKHELGFLQIYPKPSQYELNEYYEKGYYQGVTSSSYQKEYSGAEIEYINHKIEQKASIIEKVITTPGKFLDVGCGEGFVLAYFAKKGWDITGIDFSDYGILNFNPTFQKKFIKGDIYEILKQKTSNNEAFDVIWLGNVLEHVLEPLELLMDLKLLLKGNGLLVITVPNDGSKFQKMLLEKGIVNKKWWVAYPDHISYFNYESLIKCAKYTGFNCHELIADFPIDFFLLNQNSNYINDSSLGKHAHKARVEIENFISTNSADEINSFYRQLAKLGLGRDLTIFLNHGDH